MVRNGTIKISDLKDYIQLQCLELSFRIHLTAFEQFTKERLILAEELKQEAGILKEVKNKFGCRLVYNRELDKYILQILNDKFKGGINL